MGVALKKQPKLSKALARLLVIYVHKPFATVLAIVSITVTASASK